jgi:hypothetical protein
MLVLACAPRSPARSEAQVALRSADPVGWYSTRARPNGVVGGPAAKQPERLLVRQLLARGDTAEPDGALAAQATWLIAEASAGRRDAGSPNYAVAERAGFAGEVLGELVQSVEHPDLERWMRDLVSIVPSDSPITRYGIAAAAGLVAVVIGGVEASVAPFPRVASPGTRVRLAGSVPDRFDRAELFLMRSDGSVDVLAMQSRRFDTSLELKEPGVYRLQLRGNGLNAIRTLFNVRILVGAPEPRLPVTTASDPTLTSARAEAEILELVNEARRRLGLASLVNDARVAAAARADALEFAKGNVISGASAARQLDGSLRQNGVRVSMRSEFNIAGVTAAGALSGLLEDPSIRVVLVDPLYTHIGIASTHGQTKAGWEIRATMILARVPPAEGTRQTSASIEEALRHVRKIHGLSSVRTDPLLTEAARAGLKASLKADPHSSRHAFNAATAVVEAETHRTGRPRFPCTWYLEVVDPVEVIGLAHTLDPRIEAIGVATRVLKHSKGVRTAIFIAFEAAPGKELACN